MVFTVEGRAGKLGMEASFPPCPTLFHMERTERVLAFLALIV